MSRLHEYWFATFQEPNWDDPFGGGGGGGGGATEFEGLTDAQLAKEYKEGRISEEQYRAELAARQKSTPAINALVQQNKPTSSSAGITPPSLSGGAGLQSKEVRQFSDGWYVTDAQGNKLSGPHKTSAIAKNAEAQLEEQAQIPAQSAAGGSDPVGPDGRRASEVAGTQYRSEAERDWYRSLPSTVKASAEGGGGAAAAGGVDTGVSGGGGAVTTPERAFPRLSETELWTAYRQGQISEEQLRSELTAMGFNPASIDIWFEQQQAGSGPTRLDFFGGQHDPLTTLPESIAGGEFGEMRPFGDTGAVLPQVGKDPETGEYEGIAWRTDPISGEPVPQSITVPGSGIHGQSATQLQQTLDARGFQSTGNIVKDAQLIGAGNQLQASIMELNPTLSPAEAWKQAQSLLTAGSNRSEPSASFTGNLTDEVGEPNYGLQGFAEGGTVQSLAAERANEFREEAGLVPAFGPDYGQDITAGSVYEPPVRGQRYPGYNGANALRYRDETPGEAYRRRLAAAEARERRVNAIAAARQRFYYPDRSFEGSAAYRNIVGRPSGGGFSFEGDVVRPPSASPVLSIDVLREMLGLGGGGVVSPFYNEAYGFNEGGAVSVMGDDVTLGREMGDSGVFFTKPFRLRSLAKGGDMLTEEPIMGVGVNSGRPRFLLSEGERMEIEPVDSITSPKQRKAQEAGVRDVIGRPGGMAALMSPEARMAMRTLQGSRL